MKKRMILIQIQVQKLGENLWEVRFKIQEQKEVFQPGKLEENSKVKMIHHF